MVFSGALFFFCVIFFMKFFALLFLHRFRRRAFVRLVLILECYNGFQFDCIGA